MEGYFLHIARKLEEIRLGKIEVKFGIVSEVRTWEFWRATLAEFLTTLTFVFITTMSIVSLHDEKMTDTKDGGNENVTGSSEGDYENVTGTREGGEQLTIDLNAKFIRVSLTFGLMIMTGIQMIGHVSGGYMNPAVSIAMAVAMKITPLRALFYVLSQCAGAILGSLLLKCITPKRLHHNLGYNSLNEELQPWQGVLCEAILTFILVLSVMGRTDSDRALFGSPAVGVGFTIAVLHLAAIPFTGVGINPARSLGPAVVSDYYTYHWIYWAGPIGGGIVAALMYKYVFDPYRGCMTYEQAVNYLIEEKEMIVIPKRYFTEIHGLEKISNGLYTSVHL